MADEAGTWLSADFASTSWKVIPWKSGVVTLRTRPPIDSSPGSVAASSAPIACPCHRIPTVEHNTEGPTRQVVVTFEVTRLAQVLTLSAAPVDNGEVSRPEPPLSRRAAARAALTRRARQRRAQRLRVAFAAVIGGALVIGGTAALSGAIGGPALDRGDALEGVSSAVAAPAVTALPVPAQRDAALEPLSEPVAADLCGDKAVRAALDKGADAEVIAAVGGGDAFRTAVTGGSAPCLDIADAERIWVVVNKRRPLDPIDYWPEPQAQAADVPRTSGGHMRADVAEALTRLAAAALDEGAGAVGVNSGFRSYDRQVLTYDGYMRSLGRDRADLTSARPGYSEHQTGLAVDVVACNPGCGGIEAFAHTTQAKWVAQNAWRFGFIVRYEDAATEVTGYEWEPWHLRYIGVDLARAYHDGGFRSLEAFFGLEAARHYAG